MKIKNRQVKFQFVALKNLGKCIKNGILYNFAVMLTYPDWLLHFSEYVKKCNYSLLIFVKMKIIIYLCSHLHAISTYKCKQYNVYFIYYLYISTYVRGSHLLRTHLYFNNVNRK